MLARRGARVLYIGRARARKAIERVKLAESLGYESVYVTHIAAREPFTVLTAYASATERIRLGTGVTPIYARTPVATAQAAATIDEYSGGRMVLGLGVSHRPVVEGWYGQTDRQAGARDARVPEHRARDPPRREPAARREMADRLPLHGLRGARRPPDLHRRPLPGDAAPGGRARGRRRPVAVRARLHPRGRGPGGDEGPREGGQAARRVRHRRGGAVGRHGRPEAAREVTPQGPDPVLLAPLLPGDDRALRFRARHREGGRLHRHARRDRDRRGGERGDRQLLRGRRDLAGRRARSRDRLRGHAQALSR